MIDLSSWFDQIMSMPDIDGCLVGGASLTADRYMTD